MSDSKLFIDEYSNNVKNRINDLLLYTDLFDCMIGYFYVTGFSKYIHNLNATDKVRILIGSGIKDQYEILTKSEHKQISTNQIRRKVRQNIKDEFKISEDTYEIEEGVREFIEWLEEGKIEIRIYNKRVLSPKMYILKLDTEEGHVITGSTNITSTKEEDFEMNVELTSHEDYQNSLEKFNQLWESAIDVNNEYLDTIINDTWMKKDVTPYEVYLKFLYEYFIEEIDTDQLNFDESVFPSNFKMLEYQRHAVIQAKNIIEKHGGVFLSDVVGLGKTYMGALLLKQLHGKSIVIAPPTLVDKNNPGGWEQVLSDFDVNYYCESRGKVDQILDLFDSNEYENVLIDESHYFRNENTQRYEQLYNVCKNKKVILISATPYNNSPDDLLAQIKLFQNSHDSTIPNVRDIQHYFNMIRRRLAKFDKNHDAELYMEENKQVTREIREDILKHIMVRRTRHDIDTYYKNDLKKHNLEFPNVKEPILKYYTFDKNLTKKYDKTLHIITNELSYAKYLPLSNKYLIHPENDSYDISIGGFIKTLLFKRLESSLYAFKKTIQNCIRTHEKVIEVFEEKDEFYTSQNFNKNIYQILDDEDVSEIEDNILEGRIRKIKSTEFANQFHEDLKNDLELFKEIQNLWSDVVNYPKEESLIELLNTELKNKKVIIFTEFIDTATQLYHKIMNESTEKVMMFTGKSSKFEQQKVIDNFDANKSKNKQDNSYNILISTDVLSHGVNLHRSNIIINYDIPWNPTRIMQRIGRVQRLGTQFNEIKIYNFFPVDEIENTINLKLAAQNKINAFIQLLGTDAQYLTNENIETHSLFTKMTTTEDEEEVETELTYLAEIRDIRDNNPELYERITKIPYKIKISRNSDKYNVVSLLKSDNLMSIISSDKHESKELDFFTAVDTFKADVNEKSYNTTIDYYELLLKNMEYFKQIIHRKSIVRPTRNENKIQEYIKFALQSETLSAEEQIHLLKSLKVIKQGILSKNEVRELKNSIESDLITPDNIVSKLANLQVDENYSKGDNKYQHKQVILSEYFREVGLDD